MKKVLSAVLMIICLMSTAFAYELPHAFWAMNDRYTNALNSGDLQGIIDNGKQIVDLILKEPENEQTLSVMGSRLEQIALAYEKRGDYQNAATYFSYHAEYAKKNNWDDAVKISNAKVLQYTTDIRLYKETKEPVFSYYAKHEPIKGVRFGVTSDSPMREQIPGRSAILLYIGFGEDIRNGWNERIFKEAEENNQAIELAFNIPGEGNQISEVLNSQDYIIDMFKFINQYSSVPVYLRFGAEFNIWNTPAEASSYKQAFRMVSTFAKTYAPNVALVWSPNEVSAWNIEMNDYYPGDEYVDWVGVSLYAKKYFLGRNDWPENEKFNEVVFNTGRNADPIKALNEIIIKYGGRKPIMISESGASHYTRTLGDYDAEWAKLYLSKIYHYVPMVYPQVKFIAHFDKVMEGETYDYALSTNREVFAHYQKLIEAPHFIHPDTMGEESAYSEVLDYAELKATDTLYTYVHYYADENPWVHYYIDDVYAGSSYEVPHKFTGLANVAPGAHKLEIKIESKGVVTATKTMNINVLRDISIMINGKKAKVDTPPTIVNGRTLVPIRFVAAELGAEVNWDNNTKTVTIKKGSDVLLLQIDNVKMYKNGNEKIIDTAPTIINSRTMVPIRAIAEAFDVFVDWDGETSTVIIND